ncbi:MAG TPA: NAD-dependent epimerase/dehydratase family protein [Candidatus Hydrogenedentes bacterium]|nr:NAD-dependent epimerase/dehydratase family protein [Candidatus Hydrogenedentota bacterium]
MRTLMIGGTRYLGRAIVQDLVQHGYEVTALHRGKTLGTLPDRVERLQGDARDRKTLETVLREGRYDLVVDTILNAADLEWCLPMMARYAGQLVHCGSTGVYASADRLPTREDDPTPCSLGFEGKRDQDHALLLFHRKTGFRACSLRVSNVIGPGDVPLDIWGARNVAYFQRLADHKEIWVPNDGRALVQPVHVRDLAWGFRAAAEHQAAAGQIYNLSSERAVTLDAYARMAGELLGSRSEFRHVPIEAILATGKADEGGVRFVCEHMCIDSSKAHKDLGYAPKMDVRESLRETLEWMTEGGQLRP